MSSSSAWWAIGVNVQPVAGVGTTYGYFYGTEAQAKARAATYVDGTVTGPFSSEAAAKAAVAAGKTSSSPQAAETPSEIESQLGSGFSLVFGNTTGLLSRILKVVFGGVLMIIGVVKMTGAKQDILTLAKGAVLA